MKPNTVNLRIMADHDFPEYFADAIDKEKFSVTYEKDFDNMLSQ
mgnify:CR=1 FL=1